MAERKRQKPTTAKRKPKSTDRQQSERFIEAARKLGIFEIGEKFEDAISKVVRPRIPNAEAE
jgi:hypothetical protein